jgi:hypothetical protein
MSKEVHTSGIMPYFGRALMWCARIGEELKTSSNISSLEKYLTNPEARFGVWAEMKWLDVTGVNKFKHGKLRGFFDLDTGEFFRFVNKNWAKRGTHIVSANIPDDEQIVTGIIWEHMKDKWRKKFRKDQKI